MGILDGQVGEQTRLSSLVDRFLDIDRLIRGSIMIFVASVLMTPVVIYFSFRYFTASAAPWWLDVITGLNISAFLLSGGALLILGLAKLMAKREG